MVGFVLPCWVSVTVVNGQFAGNKKTDSSAKRQHCMCTAVRVNATGGPVSSRAKPSRSENILRGPATAGFRCSFSYFLKLIRAGVGRVSSNYLVVGFRDIAPTETAFKRVRGAL